MLIINQYSPRIGVCTHELGFEPSLNSSQYLLRVNSSRNTVLVHVTDDFLGIEDV